ncbi:invasion associated locus B family protein [Martelella endophytica]|uniref:Invasion associated locus B family protein n=1 Tax=Martelella endophytica TaxID=1486262 RepID=A0A0D5LT30_MAREN|nr:invasion associated locus B family protein [Martelella endophytica]AJY46912.1 Invasion associated locus B family protein [Martelella endophytica]
MVSRASTLKHVAACVFAIAGLTAAGASAQEQQQPAPQQQNGGIPQQGWFKTCNDNGSNKVCIVQNYARAENGQILTAVGLIRPEGGSGQAMIQVTVPTFRLIPAGVGVQIDTSAPQKLDYAVCTNEQCIAQAPLTDAMINAMKRGGKVTFTSVNLRQQPNPVELTLSGFTAAFDGDPISQPDLVESQRNLDESIKKMADDRRKKIEEAQQNAAAGAAAPASGN